MTDNISRRQFLLSLLSALAAATTLQGCGSPPDRDQIAQRLSHTISDPDAAKHFGQVYLKEHPDEAGIEPLLEAIGGDIDLYNPELLAVHLDQQIRNEYRGGDAVRVEGWVLCRTEARIYALMALL